MDPPPPQNLAKACASCRHQHIKCPPDCVLAPYFPQDLHAQFLNANKLFGVKKIAETIRKLDDQHSKDDAMTSIKYESDARARDPVGGCYRIVRQLKRQIDYTGAELDIVLRYLAFCKAQAHEAVLADYDFFNNIDFDSTFGLNPDQEQQGIINLQQENVIQSDHNDDFDSTFGLNPDQQEQGIINLQQENVIQSDHNGVSFPRDDANLRETIEDEGSIQFDRNQDLNDAETLPTLTNSSTSGIFFNSFFGLLILLALL